MASSNVLGLLFQIDADPAKAESALANFEKTTGKSLQSAAAQTKPFNDSLLSGRESVRLLSEEMGIHLPRAVTGAISEIMPSINMLGPALMGAFAVEEVVKFVDYLRKAGDAANEVAQSQKAIHVIADENATAMEKMAQKSLEYARSQIALLNVQVLAGEQNVESLKQQEEGLSWVLPQNQMLANAYHYLRGESKELKEAEAGLTNEYKLRDALIMILGEDMEKANKPAAERIEIMRREGMTLRQWHEEMIRGGQQAGKVAAELAKHQDELAASAIRADKAELQFTMDMEKLGIIDQKNLNFLKEYTPNAYTAAAASEHLTVARKALAGATQDAAKVEEAFKQALRGDRTAMDSMMEGAEGAAEAIASMTHSTKAVAYVRGGYDAAKAIECMAAFIESYGTDVPQLLASIQWAAAADQQFSVAGSGSRHGGGGGGGYASRYGASPSGSGRGSGGGGENQGPQLPGMGPSSQHAGVSVTIPIYGHVFADNLQTLANKIGQGIQNGSIKAFPATQSPVTKGLL